MAIDLLSPVQHLSISAASDSMVKETVLSLVFDPNNNRCLLTSRCPVKVPLNRTQNIQPLTQTKSVYWTVSSNLNIHRKWKLHATQSWPLTSLSYFCVRLHQTSLWQTQQYWNTPGALSLVTKAIIFHLVILTFSAHCYCIHCLCICVYTVCMHTTPGHRDMW